MRDSIQHYPCAFPSHSHLLQDFEFTHLRIEFEVWIFRQLCSLRGSPPLAASLQWLEFNPAGPANYPGRLVGASASFSASLLHILSLSCSRFPLRTLCAFSKRFPLVFAPTRFCLTGAAPFVFPRIVIPLRVRRHPGRSKTLTSSPRKVRSP